MPLTQDEVDQLRREHLALLESREAEKARQPRGSGDVSESEAEKEAERLRREEEVRALKAEVEAEFYSSRGYQKYVNHRGKILWLTPEELHLRKERRKRSHRKHGSLAARRQYQQVIIYFVVAAIALLIGAYLAK